MRISLHTFSSAAGGRFGTPEGFLRPVRQQAAPVAAPAAAEQESEQILAGQPSGVPELPPPGGLEALGRVAVSMPTAAELTRLRYLGMAAALIRLTTGTGMHGVVLLASLAGWLAGTVCGAAAEGAVNKEYQLKAAFVYNFTKFVEWPGPCFTNAESPIVLGVLTPNPFNDELVKAVEGRKVNGKSLFVLRAVTRIEDTQGIHLLFVSSEAEKRFPDLFATLRGRPVLTVGESESFGRQGGMITFRLEGDKLRFEIDLDAAEASGIKISAQLLKLAKGIRQKP